MRAEFRLWHERDEDGTPGALHYAMFNPDDPKKPVVLEGFPIAHESIAELMEPLRLELEGNEPLRHRVFQIEFLSTLTNDTLVTLIYHRPLDERWLEEAKQLEKKFGIAIIGRSRKQRVVVSKESVQEKFHIEGRAFHYQQIENAFSQPNAYINQKMIAWTLAQLDEQGVSTECLLELYCGNGNFTLPLSQKFKRVLATEISKSSINTANENVRLNQADNIEFVRLSGEETSAALAGERSFRRLAHLDLAEYQFDTVFVDPPRAGLDDKTLAFIAQFKTIIYISCNPNTLAANLEQLTQSHTLKAFALFDQFPYTPHLECGAILTKVG
jgi:tRNA (uracil-5-)-methyltransferase